MGDAGKEGEYTYFIQTIYWKKTVTYNCTHRYVVQTMRPAGIYHLQDFSRLLSQPYAFSCV